MIRIYIHILILRKGQYQLLPKNVTFRFWLSLVTKQRLLIIMISEQIIEDYLELEHANEEIKYRIKVSLLVVSVIFLLLLS